MGQDDSQVSGQSRAAGLIPAGSALRCGAGDSTPVRPPLSSRSRSPSTRGAPMLCLKGSEAKF